MRAPLFVGLLALVSCDESPEAQAPLDAAAADAPGGFPTTCTGACATTAVTATFGSTIRVFDRAYYGVTASASGPSLHVEAYRGGDPGCPTSSSASPDYTLVLGTVPVPTSTAEVSSPGNLLDFVGDLLGGPLGAAATAVMLVPVAANLCVTCVGMPPPSDPDGMLALDVSLTFSSGSVAGHLFATHCDELDAQL